MEAPQHNRDSPHFRPCPLTPLTQSVDSQARTVILRNAGLKPGAITGSPPPNPAKDRFTPQQAEDSPAAQTSMQINSGFARKYCLVPFWKSRVSTLSMALGKPFIRTFSLPRRLEPGSGEPGGWELGTGVGDGSRSREQAAGSVGPERRADGSGGRRLKRKATPQTRDGQVHPTATSRSPGLPNINANRFRIHPKAPCTCNLYPDDRTLAPRNPHRPPRRPSRRRPRPRALP